MTYESVKQAFEDEIVSSMARTLWIMAFSAWAEEVDWPGRASNGEDWDEVAPPTPAAADKAAAALVSAIAASEGITGSTPMAELFAYAMHIDRRREYEFDLDYNNTGALHGGTDRDLAHDFGAALAMEALGTGVAWADDHEITYGDLGFEPTMPRTEVIYDGENLSWWVGTSSGSEQAIGPRVPGFVYVNEGDAWMLRLSIRDERGRARRRRAGRTGFAGGWHTFVLTFQGDYLVIYAGSLDNAIDEMIDWVAENHPDELVDDQVNEAFRTALEANEIDPDSDLDWDDDDVQAAQQEAEADTTQGGNNAHYINSDDWSIVSDGASHSDLVEIAKVRGWIKSNPADRVTYHSVLAGAYRGKSVSHRPLLVHASIDGGQTALCRKVKDDALCDMEEDGPATCPTCIAKLAKRRS